MADAKNGEVPLKVGNGLEQKPNGGAQETAANGKMEALSPRKRDRPHIEGNEFAGNAAKRVKGVAPIKAEYVSPHGHVSRFA